MPTQQSIVEECERRKDQGIAQAEVNADGAWKLLALNAVRHVAQSQEYFSSNDIWPHIDLPREPRALGAVMCRAVTLQWIESAWMYTKSNRPTQHRQPIRVWRSLICQGGHHE